MRHSGLNVRSYRACRVLLLLAYLMALGGCGSSAEFRKQIQPPSALKGLSAVYSEFDMQLQLVTASSSASCEQEDCLAERAFDQRVAAIGGHLAETAFRKHPELLLRFPRFEFVVADKRDPGAASSSAGTVAIYRGVRSLELDDGALAFVLAREMGHIIDGHHDENVTTGILVGVAAQLLFPALNLPALFSSGAATSAAASTTATAAATAAAASATSVVGTLALRASFRPQQVIEAEAIALELLASSGWDGREVADQLEALPLRKQKVEWADELRVSAQRIAGLMQGPPLPRPGDQWPQTVPLSLKDLPPPLISVPF